MTDKFRLRQLKIVAKSVIIDIIELANIRSFRLKMLAEREETYDLSRLISRHIKKGLRVGKSNASK
ncbi:hypothetical protein QGM71_06395 [Virgibacillus sp. C22-A2]|uniref:Uncharacterized protein n=1 Tax=Virgibacillus tibetensis TaxID=3042313 RepID=A0ABU6KE78_9BACI|nr:hypothetical protein [Virgibacillus sp. C22-A2]